MTPLPEHERCDCHACTWLRASDLQKAFQPRPLATPDATRVYTGQPRRDDCKTTHSWEWMCRKCGVLQPNKPIDPYLTPKPDDPRLKPDAVEKKIKVIVELHDDKKGHLASLETRLRKLVDLARNPKF